LLIPIVGSEFIPKTDSNEFSINLTLPEGTELKRTESTVKNIEDMVKQLFGDNIVTVYSKIGPSTSLTGIDNEAYEDENTATVLIKLDKNRKISSEEIINRLSLSIGALPDIEAEFVQEQTELQTTLGTEAAPIVLEIKGSDLDVLRDLTEQAGEKLAAIDDLFNISTSFDEGRPEVDVVIDRVRAGLLNISINDISDQLTSQLSGREAGQWQNDGELQDIILRLPKVDIKQLSDITLQSGEQKISLDDVTDIKITQTTNEIYRQNQTRIGKISAFIRSDKPFDAVIKRIDNVMSGISYPPDYKYEIAGEELKRREAFDNLKFALLLSIILVYMVMASQFESLLHPFIILFTIPLAGVGSVFLFFILGNSFNVMAYIGIIMLAGIAVNDSIILVDAINRSRREGVARFDAIIDAGQRRIRPIVMTSLTTILALLPLTFGFGEGAALRAPMAWAVIGGLVTSTLLTLVVIPCVYLLVDQLGDWLRFE